MMASLMDIKNQEAGGVTEEREGRKVSNKITKV
jgi:hypothetical protein